MANRISSPATGCSSTASSCAVSVSGWAGMLTAARDDAVGLALRGAQFGAAPAAASVLSDRCGRRRPRASSSSRCSRSRCRRGARRSAVTTGTPSSADSRVEVDLDAAPFGDVEHVEHQQQRPADALEFQHQAQRQPQIGGIGDADQQVGRRLALQPPQHDVAGDFLVGAAGAQRIGAGQVDDRDAAARRRRAARRICARR